MKGYTLIMIGHCSGELTSKDLVPVFIIGHAVFIKGYTVTLAMVPLCLSKVT
jgi:hypothetical protein